LRYTSNWTGSTLLDGSELETSSELTIELLGAEEDSLEVTEELVTLEEDALELTKELLGAEEEVEAEVVKDDDEDADDDDEDEEDVVGMVVAKVPSPCQ
jgi:hypothetical protein